MSGEVLVKLDEEGTRFSLRTFWRYTGPGWLMSLAYLDPGNLEADLQAGAYGGYQLIWVLLLAHILGLLLQMLAARLAVVTGFALAENCRKHFPPYLKWILWAMSEIAIIGADLQEVIGTSIALHILFGFPYWLGTIITAVDTFTIMAIHAYRGVRVTELIIFCSVMVMMGCFWVNMIDVAPPAKQVLSGFVPSIKSYAVLQMVGLIGAVIMPHNLFLHSALVKSRSVDRSSEAAINQANKYFSIDAVIALVVSFIINIALVTSFSHGFFNEKCASSFPEPLACRAITDSWKGEEDFCDASKDERCHCMTSDNMPGMCSKIGLETAGDALHGLLHSAAKYIFGVGLLAAGQASTLTGTLSGQYVMEGFLKLKIRPWKRILLTRGIALGPALVVALLRSEFKGLQDANEWLNILQSVQLPFALLPLLYFSVSESIMGKYVINAASKGFVYSAALLIIFINFYLVQQEITKWTPHYMIWACLGVLSIAYLSLCVQCAFGGTLSLDLIKSKKVRVSVK